MIQSPVESGTTRRTFHFNVELQGIAYNDDYLHADVLYFCNLYIGSNCLIACVNTNLNLFPRHKVHYHWCLINKLQRARIVRFTCLRLNKTKTAKSLKFKILLHYIPENRIAKFHPVKTSYLVGTEMIIPHRQSCCWLCNRSEAANIFLIETASFSPKLIYDDMWKRAHRIWHRHKWMRLIQIAPISFEAINSVHAEESRFYACAVHRLTCC